MADKTERWRGITFAARRLNIANATNTAQTAFWLMATFPTTLDWSPPPFRPQIRLLRFSVARDMTLDLPHILEARTKGSVEVLEDIALPETDAAALITDKSVVVMLPGDFPIAAYIPVEHSRISITQPESTFPGSDTAPIIREDYPASSDRIDHVENFVVGGELLAYPMIDFVGPETILVTDDPAALVVTGDYAIEVNASILPGRKGVSAIIVRSPFSTRMSAMPLGAASLKTTVAEPTKSVWSTFKQPDLPARPLGLDEEFAVVGTGPVSLPTRVVPRGRGTLEVTVAELLAPVDYSRLEASLRRSDIVIAYDNRSRAPELDHKGMNFRYPPIPPIGGFNVFGLLAHLTLHVNTGRLMIGSSLVPVEAPSVVEFSDIQAFAPRRNVVPIPVVVSGREQTLDFRVETTSKLAVNGAEVRVQADRWRGIIEYCFLAAAIVTAIAAVVAVWPRGK